MSDKAGKGIFTPKEFAEQVGVTLETLYELDDTGTFVAKRKGNGHRYYTDEDLALFIAEFQQEPAEKSEKPEILPQESAIPTTGTINVKNICLRPLMTSKGKVAAGQVIELPVMEYRRLIRSLERVV
jgi:hypothetical protein